MTRTDTTLDQDRKTEGNCVCMYSVHCRVIVDNRCEFKQSSSQGDCNFDARLVSKTRKYHKLTLLRFVRMTFVLRLRFRTKQRRRVHILQSVNRSTLVSSANRFSSNQSSSSTRSNASRSNHPERRSDQLQQPSPEVRAYTSDPSSRCGELLK